MSIQKLVRETFKEAFGYTPLTERKDDILQEVLELYRATDVKNLREETGDILSSLIMLCAESGWDFEELVRDTCEYKIKKRMAQYKSLGRKTRVAILGGAFNPITKGHIDAAKFVLNTSNKFDEVWLMPCYSHMLGKKMTSASIRYEMCQRAVTKDLRIKVWDYEIKNELSGEIYNLFKRLHEDPLMETHNFSFIIGQDNANIFHQWVNYEHLEKLVSFVVIPRKGIKEIPGIDWYKKEPHIFLNKESDIIETSSTEVRRLLKNYSHFENEIKKYLNPDVLKYILNLGLYSCLSGDKKW